MCLLYDLVKPYGSAAVIGMCKNAGKTTVLNGLIRAFNAADELIGLTSIGRDGERSDLVTNTKKPEIFVQNGTLFATAAQAVELGTVSREILDVTDMSTPMGNVVLLRAMSDGYVQLAGPSMTAQLKSIRDELFSFGAKHVFLDGALSRKSLSMPSLSDAAILCSGASYSSDMDKTVQDTAYCAEIMNLEQTKLDFSMHTSKFVIGSGDNAAGEDELALAVDELRKTRAKSLLIRGAVTDSMASTLLAGGRFGAETEIVVEDSSRLLLSGAKYQKLLLAGAHFTVLERTKLLAVTVNPFSAYGLHYNKEAFFDEVRRRIPCGIEVINVMEDENC